ncbi:MAG: TonB-dependent receptor, partial [Bacteroidales bacterium]|nr:TonB-dependent receptor [Bacteroidales bacterium]
AAYSDAGTGAKQIRLLGLSGRYVQMMTENIPNFYGLASNYGLDYVPGPWMQSIAISKGTASVVYGYEALTGQINTWYKEPTHRSDNFFLNLFASSSGRTELNTDATYKLSERVRGMILVHTGNSWFEVDEDKDQFRDMPLLNRYFLFNRYNIDWNPNFETKLGVKLLYEDRQGGQVKSINNPYTISIGTRRAEAFLKSGYTFKGALHKSLAFLSSWSYHDQQGVYGFSTYDASQQSVYLNTIFTADLDEDDVHSVQTGLSFKYDAYIEDLNNLDMSRKEIVPGAFAEYSFSPSSAFLIVGGARLDYHNMYGMFFVPRMHLRYKLASLTTLKASVGKGIRTPAVLAENAYLLASSRTMQIAPDILPEMSWNYGGNIMQQIPIGNRDMTIVLDFYRTSFVDQVVVDLDDDLRKVSIYNLEGESYSNVGQIEIQYPFIKGMDLTAAFRYNDVKQNIAGVLREVPFTSRYKGLISASYKTALEKWQFDYTVQFNGGGRIPSTAANPEQYRREDRFDPYIIMNAQITKFFKKWEMYAGVENLTNFVQKNPIIAADNPNSEYFDAAMIWGPLHGRKFYLGMRYNINKN